MKTRLSHSVRINPAVAVRLKHFAVNETLTMGEAIELLLDVAGAPRDFVLPSALWAGEPEAATRLQTVFKAAEAAGNESLAAFARKRLSQIEKGTQDDEHYDATRS